MARPVTARQERIKHLREKLLGMTEQERRDIIAERGLIATIEGRTLSLHNTLFVYIQCNGVIPTIVGGYRQWQAAGQQVRGGEHGFTILFPVGDKDTETGEIIGAARFYTGTVFDVSQVEPREEASQ